MATTINKGFIKDWQNNTILPITRGELVVDKEGKIALTSSLFAAGYTDPITGRTNEYGLISAAERAMLGSGGAGTGIDDIYNKLSIINNGIQVNGTALNFYNTSGTATPINFQSNGDGNIVIGAQNNIVHFNLQELTSTETTASNILKSITVDKYGRVTAVSGSPLTNAEIPTELSGKTINDTVLGADVTTDGGTTDKSIINKKYVDDKFNQVTGIATGALHFEGALGDSTEAANALSNNSLVNAYYKVVTAFNLSKDDLFDTTGITGSTLRVEPGDTLIIHQLDSGVNKWVYIPSANDITTITITDGTNTPLNKAVGDVYLSFDAPFTTTAISQGVKIAMPAAAAGQSGYLTGADYERFNDYASNLLVSYVDNFTTGYNLTLGTIKVGTNEYTVHGWTNTSSLVVNNGASNDKYNPILKFTETSINGAAEVSITFANGNNGIIVERDGNIIKVAANNTLVSGADKYLTIANGSEFGVKIGKVESNTVTHGLTDFAEFAEFRSDVYTTGVRFDLVNGSLFSSSSNYYYGSVLASAVAVEI